MPASLGHAYTLEEYLALEEGCAHRNEFHQGEIYAMAGGTPEHAALSMAVALALGGQLREPCRLYSSDLRIAVTATGLYTYPDLAVVCGEPQRAPESPTHVVNPILLVEVLSDGTRDYDRTTKLEHYLSIPSVREILFVSHDERRLTVVDHAGVERSATTGRLALESVGAVLDVDDVYDRAGVRLP